MILIRGIDWIEVDSDQVEFMVPRTSYSRVSAAGCPSYEKIKIELIRGRRFVRPSDGTDIVVGVTDEAGKILGLQYEIWKTMETSLYHALEARDAIERELTRTRVELERAAMRLEEIADENLWKRLKRIFNC